MLGQLRRDSQKRSEDRVTRLTWQKLLSSASRVLRDGTATLVGHRVYSFAPHSVARLLCFQDLNTWKFESVVLPGFQGRYNHAIELVDDKIYIFGGKPNVRTYLEDLIEFDLVSWSARLISTTGGPGKRGSMTAVYIPWRSEIIYFGGIKPTGTERRCNDTFALNVDNLSWTELNMRGTLPCKRTGHNALRFGRCMYVYGGYATNGIYLDDLQIAEFGIGRIPTWSTPLLRGNAPPGRTVPAINCIDGRIICFGGYSNRVHVRNSMIVYDTENERWGDSENGLVIVEGEAPEDTSSHLGVTVRDGIIYFTRSGVFKLHVDT